MVRLICVRPLAGLCVATTSEVPLATPPSGLGSCCHEGRLMEPLLAERSDGDTATGHGGLLFHSWGAPILGKWG